MTRRYLSARSALFTCSLLLVAVPVLLTWRVWRQVKLDQALIAAVKHNDTPAVQADLKQGADANAEDGTGTSFWAFLHNQITRRPPHATSEYGSSALWTALKVDEMETNSPEYKPTDPRILTLLVEHSARFQHSGRPTHRTIKWELRPPHEVLFVVSDPPKQLAGMTTSSEDYWDVQGTQEQLVPLYAAIQSAQAKNGGDTKETLK